MPIVSVVQGYWNSFIHTLDPNVERQNGTVEWVPYGGADSRERLFIQTNNTKMESMSPAQSLRCDVVRPMSQNLGKPPAKGTITELDAALASKMNSTSDSTGL